MTTKPCYSEHEVQRFMPTMRAVKETERTNDVEIFTDALMRSSLVVQDGGGQLWIVPRCRDGWRRRHKLTLTSEARSERLRPAKVDRTWLVIPEHDTPAVTA